MLFTNLVSLLLLPLFCSASAIPSRRGNSGIVAPAKDTVIAPGAQFDFKFDTSADYGISSYNFTVILYTDMPTSMAPSENFGSGYYFGRFAEPNYPGNPNPVNPAPAKLTMPDFSKPQGGFGAGAAASGKKVYLVVLEEYGSGSNVGYKLSMAIQELIYNGTSSA